MAIVPQIDDKVVNLSFSLTPCKGFAFAVSRSGKETLLRKASETTALREGL